MNNNFMIKELVSKTGHPILEVNGYLLHSKYNPLKEANTFSNNNFKPHYQNIIFGYGLGYNIKSIIEMLDDDETLLIYEPILKDDIIESSKIILCYDLESFKRIIKEKVELSDKINIICSPNYDLICPGEYKEFLKLIKEHVAISKVNENTVMAFSELWQKNYILNLQHALRDSSLNNLENSYNCPVVVASGGPSLSKQIPLLKKNREKFILISSGSAINSLLKEGINPDFAVSIDGTELNYNHYKHLHLKNTAFVYVMPSHPSIREHFLGDAYFAFSNAESKLEAHFRKVIGKDIIYLKGGGSVAHYALSIALYITRGPICLIGQDLAYTNNKTHADNNIRDEKVNPDDLLNNGAFYTEGYYGEEVITDYSFYHMKDIFEQLTTTFSSEKEVYNCTEGGVNIKGYKNIPFIEFCEKIKSVDDFSLNTNQQVIDGNYEERKRRLINYMVEEISTYYRIKKILVENLDLIKKNKSNTYFAQNILKKLDINDRQYKKLVEETALNLSLDAVNLNVLKNYKPEKDETPIEIFKRVKNQNIEMYKKMLEATNNAISYSKLLIEKLELEGEKI